MAATLEKFKRDIIGVLWGAGALFLGLALLSFNPGDPSFNSVSRNSESVVKVASNLCGFFGSFLSDLLYRSLGLTSWMLVVLATWNSINSFQGLGTKFSKEKTFLRILFLLLIASLF